MMFNMAKNHMWKIDLSLADKLRELLLSQGFELSTPPYTCFSGKKKGVSCTLYESGKLMVQGKDMAEFIEYYLEPEILHDFSFSHAENLLDLTPRIGMDEAGKGDYFGPLCFASLFADEVGVKKLFEWGVKDSKKMTDSTILKLAKKIRAEFSYTVIRLFPAKYNELYGKFKNLNRLMAWAHTAALAELSQKTGCQRAILDKFGDKSLVERQMEQKKLTVDLEQKVRAEEDIVVAGASILARAAFVEGMDQLSEKYGLELPKGAASHVKTAARTLVQQFGSQILNEVAKTHFKTTNDI